MIVVRTMIAPGGREEKRRRAEGPARQGPRVLLVHMPMADPIMPNLGIEILATRLRDDGISCGVFYGTLRMPPTCSPELMHGMAGYGLFAPAYFDLDVDAYVASAAECISRGTDSAPYEPMFDDVAGELYGGIAAAEMCIESCLRGIPVGEYDVIGFSIIFDTQKIPSVTLAKALKAREPGLRILLGGTGCDGDMAAGMLDHFPEVDAVLRGDAEDVIAGFVRQWGGGTPAPEDVPANAVIRGGGAGRAATDGKIESLAGRKSPDYASYIRQWRASPYREGPLTLLFEASRGCWWGEKHHCRFCGIRTVAEGYRDRASDAVFDEILSLHARFSPDLLYATDAILSREHMRFLLPRLAVHRRETGDTLRLFFEIKSTVTRRDAALMAASGIVAVQPGIESFSTNVLRNMDKGAIGIRQIAALKWLGAYEVDTIYGLLVGTPGETADDLEDIITLIGGLHHLQAPVGINPLALHRFSPYWRERERWGIRNVRPFPIQALAFRAPRATLERICYELAYDSNEHNDPQLRMLRGRLRDAIVQWQVAFARGERLIHVDSNSMPLILRRSGSAVTTRLLSRHEHALYGAIAQPVSAARAAELAGVKAVEAEATLMSFAAEGLALTLDNLWLGLAQPAAVDAWSEAGLEMQSSTPGPRAIQERLHGLAPAAAADGALH